MSAVTREPAGPDLLEKLGNALGPGGVTPPAPGYLEEPRGRYAGRAAAVLRPRSTQDVAAAVAICNPARVGIIPYAGGTGLVGGQTFDRDAPLPVILSVERLNRIRDIDLSGNSLVAGAGTVLAEVQMAAAEVGRLFPLQLASGGSARIGGLLGTNAGGVNVLRYGNARDLCLGIEAVMADGSVLHGLSRVMKDNMGYDLRNLLIGSEGTLGIITAASLRLHPATSRSATAWIAVETPQAALDLLAHLRAALGGAISAFELIHRIGFEFLARQLPQIGLPPDAGTSWVVLTEANDAAGSGISERMTEALASAMEQGLVSDALLASSEAQRAAFWNVRETIPEANRLTGSISSHDVSVPPARLPEFISRGAPALARLDPGLRINCFGHLGDGNLHYNVFPPEGRDRSGYDGIRHQVKQVVHDLVDELGGSVGAEHGVGRLKVPDLERYGDPTKLAAMRAIKAALDPNGILNPGAVLRAD